MTIPRVLLSLTVLFSACVHAQSDRPPASVPHATTIESWPAYLASGFVEGLRGGGYAIYFRNGPLSSRHEGSGAREGEWWKDCFLTDKLNDDGMRTAQTVSRSLRTLSIPIGAVYMNEFCRSLDTRTAMGLDAGISKYSNALNTAAAQQSVKRDFAAMKNALQALLAMAPADKTNWLLIGDLLEHEQVTDPLLAALQPGESAILRHGGMGRFSFVARLTPGDWAYLVKLDAQRKVAAAATAAAATSAQPVATPVAEAPATPPRPAIPPDTALAGAQLLQSLRNGGYVLFMRHALANVGMDQDLQQIVGWQGNCTTQRNLSDVGRMEAVKVGAALRRANIPIHTVKISEYCRVHDTAKLMAVGEPIVTEDLNFSNGYRKGKDVPAARLALFNEVPVKGNTLLISHGHTDNLPEHVLISRIAQGEIAVLRPVKGGNAIPVARIAVADWDKLLATEETAKNGLQEK